MMTVLTDDPVDLIEKQLEKCLELIPRANFASVSTRDGNLLAIKYSYQISNQTSELIHPMTASLLALANTIAEQMGESLEGTFIRTDKSFLVVDTINAQSADLILAAHAERMTNLGTLLSQASLTSSNVAQIIDSFTLDLNFDE